MALHEYKCKDCGYEFEELINNEDEAISCKRCGGSVDMRMSVFSSVVQGSSNESIDKKIGVEAERRWQMHHERKVKRHKMVGKQPEPITIPQVKGKSLPAMVVGTHKDKEKRQEYSVALNEHREKRMKRGQPQFSEAGSF